MPLMSKHTMIMSMMALGAPLANAGSDVNTVVDLSEIEKESTAGMLTKRVMYKLRRNNAEVNKGPKYQATLASQVAEILTGCSEPARLFRPAGKHEAAHVKAGLHLWYVVECEDPLTAIQAFSITSSSTSSAVEKVEPELNPTMYVESNDAQLADQTHYPAINLFEAWDVERGSPEVVVQVLDTGIDMSHEDMQLNIWTNVDEICGNGIDDDNNGFVDDCHGYNHADNTGDDLLGNHWHGTHCGGTIAADTDNSIGVAGVAGGTPTNPGAKLMISVGFGDSNTGGFAEALLYGADNGAHISSNSWGYTAPGAVEQSVLDAIDYANSKNTMVVFAAGNDNSNGAYYPGYYDGTIAVAAVQDNGVRASFSNYGDWIDIAAPGVNVFSTLTNNGYGTASGTSMACPHFAGVLALGKSIDLTRSNSDLLDCAYTTARNIDSINGGYEGALGAGYVDAAAYVNCVKNGAPSPAPTMSLAPTTAAPSLKPTISKAPTKVCGACDQVLTLSLLTDNYPGETTWELDMFPAESPTCFDSSSTGGPFNNANSQYDIVISDKICEGETYEFTISDSYGDGICCSYGNGNYMLSLNGNELVSGGDFQSSQTTTFTAPIDDGTTKSPTKAPTKTPTKAPSRAPTRAPTTLETPPTPLEFTMRSHPKLGEMLVARWKMPTFTVGTSHDFVFEYQFDGETEWHHDFEGPKFPEWDGHFYHVLSDSNLPCGSKLYGRVKARNNGQHSDPAVSSRRKIKC